MYLLVEDYTSSNSDGGGGDVEVAGDRTKLSTAAGELVGEKEDLLGNLQGTVLAEEGQGEREGPQEGDRLGFAKEISIAMAYVVPLPHSPSTNSSSPSSSIFVTPASTPSRSPSPLPPSSSSSHPHFLTSSPQVITSLSGLVDGYHDNELPELTPNDAHQNESHSGEPQLPTYPPHPVTTDAYAQTEVPSIASSFSQTDAPVLKEFIEMCTNTECSELIDSGVQTDEEGERGRTEVACNTELRIPPEVLERAKLAEQLAQIQSEHAAGMYIEVVVCTLVWIHVRVCLALPIVVGAWPMVGTLWQLFGITKFSRFAIWQIWQFSVFTFMCVVLLMFAGTSYMVYTCSGTSLTH